MSLKTLIILLIPFSLFCCTSSDKSAKDDIKANSYAVKMGETCLLKYPSIWSWSEERVRGPKWAYAYGLIATSFIHLWEYTGDERYWDRVKDYADTLINREGIIKGYKKEDYNIDKINSGKMLFHLYKRTGDKRYKIAMDTLREQLRGHPRTKIGGFWHKKRYPHQMWLDGIYMGGPFYAQYAKEFNEPESFDEIALWYMNLEKVTRDPESGLLYHGWDESKEMFWADKETGASLNFWGRGMGWYAMALVDVLDYFPKEHAKYDSIIAITQRFAAAIVKVQDPATGVWYQVLDQGNREGNYLEASVSTMFSYFLLKAINKSYIDRDTYYDSAIKAFNGTVNTLVKIQPDSSLMITPTCGSAGLGQGTRRDGTYEYYISEKIRHNDTKAVGPFIMAAIQYNKLRD
jgi:unsaturated rhamnogalacturonyl hydrolase